MNTDFANPTPTTGILVLSYFQPRVEVRGVDQPLHSFDYLPVVFMAKPASAIL
jgi:hypothetical protein